MTGVLRALHAEGRKRGLDHEALHDLAVEHFGAESLADLSEQQVRWLFAKVSGREFHAKRRPIRDAARRRAAGTAGRSGDDGKVIHLASGSDLEMLGEYAAKLGWGKETLRSFIRRQLRGREVIRTLGDLNKVLWGMKRMARGER